MNAMAVLEASSLTKRYGAHVAVDSLDLVVEAGEIFALLGSNGAGKTTTVHMFMGFVAPTSGAARVVGKDVQDDARAARAALAYLPESLALYPHLTGLQNLRYFSELGSARARSEAESRALLERVGLTTQAADRKLATYSKGMRQKVGLALALGKDAKALLLDEPFSGLDPKASNDLSKSLRDLAEGGVAILMATHDIFRAKSLADRIGIMREGRLVARLASKEVTFDGLEQRYLAEMGS